MTKTTSGNKILFIGDSITDCFRRDKFPPLGNGYVLFFDDLIKINNPELKLTIINKGISGNTIIDLKERWEDDVIFHKPDKLSVLIGINDLHRYVRGEEIYSPEHYYKNYYSLLELTVKKLDSDILLMSPFYISKANTLDTFRKKVLSLIPSYISKVEKLSEEFSTMYINLHEVFQKRIELVEPETFAPEPVHPNRTGHLLIALEVYKKLI
ncbi:MAG: SGNH/GDSL hydrolase family protein [Thermoproteales archaeon]|nr:SGNH/GDSL hydrolase family protein [Thermoproteales archaeon]